MSEVAKSFICRGCLNPVTSAGRTSVDIGASAKLELMDKFCYLGDMLSVDGDADATVEARIGWNKFRQLVPLLTNKDVSLIMRGRLYSSCVRSTMQNPPYRSLSFVSFKIHYMDFPDCLLLLLSISVFLLFSFFSVFTLF